MDYSKVGPVCEQIVKLAELEGFKFPKLVVVAWKDSKIKLELVCFRQGTRHVKHTLSNEDTIYEELLEGDICECIYQFPIPVTYDRIHNTYREDVSELKEELMEIAALEDSKFDALRTVISSYAMRGAKIAVENIQRRISLDSRELSIIKRHIDHMNNEEDDKLNNDKKEDTKDDSNIGYQRNYANPLLNAISEHDKDKFRHMTTLCNNVELDDSKLPHTRAAKRVCGDVNEICGGSCPCQDE